MSHAYTSILVGVTSSVSEILLPSKTAKFFFQPMDLKIFQPMVERFKTIRTKIERQKNDFFRFKIQNKIQNNKNENRTTKERLFSFLFSFLLF